MKKAMRDCTGEEVCREWLYHIGVPTEKIDALAHDACNTTTCFMPYINAFFQPRKESDRPKVVPDGAVNFAFIGQFAETPRDTIFTTEYSMRTGMVQEAKGKRRRGTHVACGEQPSGHRYS